MNILSSPDNLPTLAPDWSRVRTCSLLPYTRLSCRGVTPVKNRILASRGLLNVYEVLMMTALIGIIPMSK